MGSPLNKGLAATISTPRRVTMPPSKAIITRCGSLKPSVTVTKGAAKTYEFVGADGQQLLGFEAATNKLTDYIYLGDVKIAQKEKTGAAAAVVSYLHNDLLGSPILSTNAAGATLWKETYQPYGAPHVKSVGKVGRQTGYLGKPYEEATGLSYLGARNYKPVLGRFM